MIEFTEAATAGSRAASLVRIVGQRDENGDLLSTRWLGQEGIVVRVHHRGERDGPVRVRDHDPVRDERSPPPPMIDWRPKRIEGCACGGVISADPSDTRDVLRAVQKHQQSRKHREWLDRRENGNGETAGL